MKKEKAEQRVIERTLNRLSARRKAPLSMYILLLLLFVIAAVIVRVLSASQAEVVFFGRPIPATSFTGVFSAFSEICVIFMTFYCGKKGFYTALGLLLLQIPMVLVGIIVRNNVASIPGVFGTLLAIVAITVIYVNNKQVDTYQKELRDQAVTDQLTGLPNRFSCARLLADLIEKGDRFAIVSIDINGFKSINNTMGFETGNDLLCEISSRWKKIADTGISGTLDFITRVSGDEFVLVIRNYHTDKDIILFNGMKDLEVALSMREAYCNGYYDRKQEETNND